jgi:hypothetical protein
MGSDSVGSWNFREISQTLSGFIAELLTSLAADLEIR